MKAKVRGGIVEEVRRQEVGVSREQKVVEVEGGEVKESWGGEVW